MYITLIILATLVAILLILIILIQKSKGGGLSSEFSGAAATSQMFGVKKTTDLLELITWGFAGAILLFSLTSYVLVKSSAPTSGGINSANIEKVQSLPTPGGALIPPMPEPGSAAPAGADSTQ